MNNNLTAIAKDNTIRVSPLKLANVVRSIVNLKASKAVNQLKFSNKRISKNVLTVLNAAIANAENNKQLDIDNLFVKEAYVGKSLTMKRFRPRAKGRASSIVKPFSKLTIIVQEKQEEKKVNKTKKQNTTKEKTKESNK
tara:strand:+ start:89 stop:505 length:417 start_codon:yes stop_codon:yes gene_type:complete